MAVRVISAGLACATAIFVAATGAFAQGGPPSGPPTAANPWVRLAPFPVPSQEVYAGVAAGKLYVFAGLHPNWKPKALVYEYDPAANKWTEKKPMPLAIHHPAMVSHNDKIYFFGGLKYPDAGQASWELIDNSWEYDPANDSWKALAPLPARRGSAGAALVDGKVYVVGGVTTLPGKTDYGLHPMRPHLVVGTVEEYDIAGNTWRPRAVMPTPRNHHGVAAVGGKIYAIGGRVSSIFITTGSNIDVVEAYDPATDSWSRPLKRMPKPRSGGATGVYNGRIYYVGGETQDADMLAAFRSVEAYDPATNQWHILPPMLNPRHGHAGEVLGDRFYTVSGSVQSAAAGTPTEVDFTQAMQLNLVAPEYTATVRPR
jgi:N-acetylneuraminic acid mutarotase